MPKLEIFTPALILDLTMLSHTHANNVYQAPQLASVFKNN